MACFRLREECSDESDGESDGGFVTPPQSPTNADTDDPHPIEDVDIENCLAYSEDEDDINCPELTPSESEESDSDSDNDAAGLRRLCPNPTCYRYYWSDYGDCRDCVKRHEEELKLNCAKLGRKHRNGHGPAASEQHEITDEEYLINQNMTDDELVDLLSAGNITEDSEGYNSDNESPDRSSSSTSGDTSPTPDIKLYPAATCPGIPRTGNTPDIPWWEVYGGGEFGSAAEALLDMAEDGLKIDEETKQALRI